MMGDGSLSGLTCTRSGLRNLLTVRLSRNIVALSYQQSFGFWVDIVTYSSRMIESVTKKRLLGGGDRLLVLRVD